MDELQQFIMELEQKRSNVEALLLTNQHELVRNLTQAAYSQLKDTITLATHLETLTRRLVNLGIIKGGE